MNQQIILNGLSIDNFISIFREIVSEEIAKTPRPKPEKEFFGLEEAAIFLGLSKSTIYRLTSANEIPHIKKGGKIWFERTVLIAWLKDGK